MPQSLETTRDVILRTPHWDHAISFYHSLMGLKVTYEDPALMGFDTGAFTLYVEKGAPHAPVFEFLVADLEAARGRLLEAGCTVIEEDPAMPRCYLRDPFGMSFNLREKRPRPE